MTRGERVADGIAAAVVAGALSGAPSTLHALATRRGLLDATAAAGTLLVPANASRPTRVVAGGVAHAGLSLGWGVALAWLAPDDTRPTRAAAWGALAGLGIAALDLGTVGRRRPAIRSLPPVPQVLDHLAFGAIAGWVISRRRRGRSAGRR